MQPLGALSDAHSKVLRETRACLALINKVSAEPCETVAAGIALLDQLRREVYEDLNQIQHEHLIVCAAQWLQRNEPTLAGMSWSWNPRQTGDHSEPDLRCTKGSVVILSAEITTSERPTGTIETRMKSTLAKLAQMEGLKYYFVRTPEMAKRANTKIAKSGWSIQVVNLGRSGDALTV